MIFSAMRLLKYLFLMLMLILSASPLAADDDFTPRQNEILMTALAGDGWLTQSMHREFWAAIPKDVLKDPKEVAYFVAMMEKNALGATRFQQEAWASMKLSLAARKVVRTPGYEAEKAASLSFATALGPQIRQQTEVGLKNADVMIEAAATGKPAVTPRETFYITKELIDQTLSGLDGSIFRARRLLNPVWSSKVQEYAFPEAHLRILWEGPLNKQATDFKTETGQAGKFTMLGYQISETGYVQISFGFVGGRSPDPEDAMIRVTIASLEPMGIANVRPMASRWRNRAAAEASGVAAMPDGSINVSVRTIEAPEHGGFWQIMGVSSTSRIEALQLREMLEKAVQFDG